MTSSTWLMKPSNTGALPAYRGWPRPSGVNAILRAMPISRPRGLAATEPPAATTAIWAAQQLPKPGTPAANAARAKSIWARTSGVSS